jgi:Protein of unknown function (DUF3102)
VPLASSKTLNDLSLTPFNYAELPAEVRAPVGASADRIRNLMKRTVDDIISCGHELETIKKLLPHGAFGQWLSAEFGMSERSAERYMRAARWAKGKSDTLTILEPAALYLLSAPSTPEPVQEIVARKAAAGERLAAKTIREMVRDAKETARADRGSAMHLTERHPGTEHEARFNAGDQVQRSSGRVHRKAGARGTRRSVPRQSTWGCFFDI